MVSPLFDYCDVVLGALPQKSQFKLQKLQNSACRLLLRQGPRSSVTQMHKELKLEQLSVRWTKHILNHVYKGVNELFSVTICNKLALMRDHSAYETRATGTLKLKVPPVRLKVCEQNFFYKGPMLWNKLDEAVKSAPTFSSFKRWMSKIIVWNHGVL